MSAASSASRVLLRRQQLPLRQQLRQQVPRRNYADSTADKAKEAASKVTSKASEGLSKVTSSAGPIVGKAASGAANAVSNIGGRTGRLISYFSSLVPPTIYYSKVGLELSRLIFQGQKMSPPSLAQFQSYFQPLLQRISKPSTLFNQAANTATGAAQSAAQSAAQMSPETALQRVRNFDRAALARGGVLAAEILGFFTVGEILGKFKVIGYRGEVHHEH